LCNRNSLDVTRGRIDARLPFDNDSFDYSICNVTIQMVNYPEVLLNEMKRISKYQIISFPNFAFYKNRLDLLFNGRMPKPMLFGYKWYNTGHLHQLSIKDFNNLVQDAGGLKILDTYYLASGNPLFNLLMKLLPNLFQIMKIVLTCKD
jgi:methionine biosynthesis protein MetW